MFITVIEGPDGSGKSTLATAVVDRLRVDHPTIEVIHGHEPNDLITGLRTLVLRPTHSVPDGHGGLTLSTDKLSARVSIGLTAASYAKTIENARRVEALGTKPVLLVLDRSVLSAFAYQSIANTEISVDQKLEFCHSILSVYDAVSHYQDISHVIWLDAQFGDDNHDVYSELGVGGQLRDAYASMAAASARIIRDGSADPWGNLLLDVAQDFTLIENQSLSLAETVTTTLESLDGLITRLKSGHTQSV